MRSSLNLLFLSRWFPYPADNGSKIRIYNLVRRLAERHRVDLISFTSEPAEPEHLQHLKQFVNQVETCAYRPFSPSSLQTMLGFFSPEPRSVRGTYNLEMHRLVLQALVDRSYDAVIASQVDMAPYALLAEGTPKILEELELTVLYEAAQAAPSPTSRFRRNLMWKKWAGYTRKLVQLFDGLTVVSEAEKALISQVTGAVQPIQVVPNGVDIAYYTGEFGQPRPGTLIFSGALTYGANFDAMRFFLGEVYPLIQEQRPDVQLAITGKLNGVPVDHLPRPDGVQFTGFLEDIRPAIAQSWVNVVPLRIGGGTRLKVLESLALGTPVVSTSKGIEGLDLREGEDYLVGDDPRSFATQVLRLIDQGNLRMKLSSSGRKAAAPYDWEQIAPSFINFVEETTALRQKI